MKEGSNSHSSKLQLDTTIKKLRCKSTPLQTRIDLARHLFRLRL